MDGQENIFTQSRVRHLRFLFFIEAGTSFQVLAKLIIDNYRLWGGAYNPFVPVDGDAIRENYKGVLGSCDPDYIFYSKGIDLEKLKSQCPHFHPKGFVELDEHGRNNFDGVYSGYMLAPELFTDMWFERRNTLLNFSNGLEHDTLSFYELSFGFGPRFVEDNAAGGGLNVIEVGEQKFADLNKIIHENKPVFSRLLSAKYHVGTLIAPNNDWEVNSFELVLYDEDTSFEELIYFWNRKLFQLHDNKIRQLIASRKQVMELIEDTYFETLLYEFLFGEKLYLRSVSIDSQGLNEIAFKMQKKFRRVQVHVRTTAEFPYKVMRYRFVSENDYPFDKAPVNGKSQYLILSQPLFKHSFPSFRGKFVCDVMIIKEGQTRTDSIRFLFLPQCTIWSLSMLVGSICCTI